MKKLLILFIACIAGCSMQAQPEVIRVKREPAPEQPASKATEIYTIVDEPTEFPGGIKALINYIKENIHYPARVSEDHISGRVFAKFIVNEDGKISDPQILKSLAGCPDCDDETLRLINAMPLWKPAMLQGKTVKCYFTLPVKFN